MTPAGNQNSAEKAKQLLELLRSLGAFAEMAHHFYSSMINAGADKTEATAGMQGFISAYWHEVNNGRRENREDEQDK